MSVTSVVIRVDPTRCRGHGICALFFADGVELDPWGYGRSVGTPAQGRLAVARARRAGTPACPNGAIACEVVDPRAGDSLHPW